ncbi:hypothetical protein FRB98_003287 [Tulasnella sp. 332]|nr:hypothetical protein FRB98_003287 [Tulasnella sp. 332]
MADLIDYATYTTPNALHGTTAVAPGAISRTKRPFDNSNDDDSRDQRSDEDDEGDDEGDSGGYVMTGGGGGSRSRSQRKRVRSGSPSRGQQDQRAAEREAGGTPDTLESSEGSVGGGALGDVALPSALGETSDQPSSSGAPALLSVPSLSELALPAAPGPPVSPTTWLQPTPSPSSPDLSLPPLRTRRGNSGVLSLSAASPNPSVDLGAQQRRSPLSFPSPAQTRVFNDTIEPLRHSPTTFIFPIHAHDSPPLSNTTTAAQQQNTLSPIAANQALQRPLPSPSTLAGERSPALPSLGFSVESGMSTYGLGLAPIGRGGIPSGRNGASRPWSLLESRPRTAADLEPLPTPPAMSTRSRSPIVTPPTRSSQDSIWEAARPTHGLEAFEQIYRRHEARGRASRSEGSSSLRSRARDMFLQPGPDDLLWIREELRALEEHLSSSDAMDLDSPPSAPNSPPPPPFSLPWTGGDTSQNPRVSLPVPPALSSSARTSLSLGSGRSREQEREFRSWEEEGERDFVASGPALSPNRRSFSSTRSHRSRRPLSLSIQATTGESSNTNTPAVQPRISVADYDGSRSPHAAPFPDDDSGDSDLDLVPDMLHSTLRGITSGQSVRRASAPTARQSSSGLARAQSTSDLSRYSGFYGQYRSLLNRSMANSGPSVSPPDRSTNSMDYDISPPTSPPQPTEELPSAMARAQARRRRLSLLDTTSGSSSSRTSSRHSPLRSYLAPRADITLERPTARPPIIASYHHDSPASISSSIPPESARSSLASGSLQTLLTERLQRARDQVHDYYSIISPRPWDPATPSGSSDRPELSPLTPSHPLPAAPRLIPRTLSIGDQRIRTGYTPQQSRNNSLANPNGALSPIAHSPLGAVGADGRVFRSALMGWGDYRPGTHSPLLAGSELPSNRESTSENPTPNLLPWRGWTDETHSFSPPIPTSNRSYSATTPGPGSPSLEGHLSPLSAQYRNRPSVGFAPMSPTARIPHGLAGRPAALFREEVRQAVVAQAANENNLRTQVIREEGSRARDVGRERRSGRTIAEAAREVLEGNVPSNQSPTDRRRPLTGMDLPRLRQMRTRFEDAAVVDAEDDGSGGNAQRASPGRPIPPRTAPAVPTRRRRMVNRVADYSDDEMDFESDFGTWNRRPVSPPPALPPTPPPRSRHSINGLTEVARSATDPTSSDAAVRRAVEEARRRLFHYGPGPRRAAAAADSTSTSASHTGHRSHAPNDRPSTPPPNGSRPHQNPALSPLEPESASNTFGRAARQRLSSPSPTRPDRDSFMTEAYLRVADRRRERARLQRQFSSDLDHQPPSAFDDEDASAFFHTFGTPPDGAPRPRVRDPRGSYDWDFPGEHWALQHMMSRFPSTGGLPAHTMALLPVLPYKDSKEAQKEERCPICLDDYGQEDTVMGIAECGHFFHKDCFQPWLKTSRTCPYCRQNINPKRPSGCSRRQGGPPPPPPAGSGSGGPPGSSYPGMSRSMSSSRTWFETLDPW